MNQIFHHYTLWEDANNGMWKSVSGKEREVMLEDAVRFTGDHILYGSWMMKVIKAWPVACEQNLTNQSINHQAWIGHAAVCLALGIPEDITRDAWWKLTDRQRNDANKQADAAIAAWTSDHKQKTTQCQRGQLELTY